MRREDPQRRHEHRHQGDDSAGMLVRGRTVAMGGPVAAASVT